MHQRAMRLGASVPRPGNGLAGLGRVSMCSVCAGMPICLFWGHVLLRNERVHLAGAQSRRRCPAGRCRSGRVLQKRSAIFTGAVRQLTPPRTGQAYHG